MSIGPESYQGLPGAILMLSIDGEKTQYKATAVSLEKPLKENLTPPKKGKKVSSEEFMRLVEERTKELTENLDGASFIIRN